MSKPIVGYRFDEQADRPIHDGDCWFWQLKICTCGLLHKVPYEGYADEWFIVENNKQFVVYGNLIKSVTLAHCGL